MDTVMQPLYVRDISIVNKDHSERVDITRNDGTLISITVPNDASGYVQIRKLNDPESEILLMYPVSANQINIK